MPSILNVAPVADVTTRVAYLVRVLTPQAETCAQHRVVSGYCTVPSPIWITTGALIVGSTGIDCASTMQTFSPSLYEFAGSVMTRLPPVKATLVEIAMRSHSLHTFLHAIFYPFIDVGRFLSPQSPYPEIRCCRIHSHCSGM